MGAAIGDYDRDGVFDWFVTAIRPEDSTATGNRLYRGTVVELEVRWPGGIESKRGGVELDQFLTVEMSEIFRDSFESGQLDAWSSAQP